MSLPQISLDPATVKALPRGRLVVSVDSHGKTNGAKGLKVVAELAGEERVYFLKITEGKQAINMAVGEWEDWFLRQFRLNIQWEQYVRGPDPEMEQLVAEFSTKVIPRLLRPLQTGGRNIKPSLCHADIEHGNIHLDLQTQEPIIFDPCCVYGHHEFELGMFRGPNYGWGREFIEEYLKEIPPSEP
ncbi:hypothetical protein QBC33DRAFT_564193 [Phialemonium atrogriseum]|uniref:protein-ribulosamine 3-kinase n=1 Tax=Phialemonium atrogriseum TaxID=1093897 RepID=A0AAJ0BPX9_9PEZI|nr:uncharacterized protein QBC33DRAFT_564193 [Phialemonium atrogriseum]KAK1762055.1 hypothetical protein QBC33DRAFT_564193 [Phialemonium atrogriseum]